MAAGAPGMRPLARDGLMAAGAQELRLLVRSA